MKNLYDKLLLLVGRMIASPVEIQSALATCNLSYLDAKVWAKIQKVTEKRAEQDLLDAQRKGILERRLLVESNEPVRADFLTDESAMGTSVPLAEFNFAVDDDVKVSVTRRNSRIVYVPSPHYFQASK